MTTRPESESTETDSSRETVSPAVSAENALADLRTVAAAVTPARLLVGRAGPAYRTATWLQLRQDHAAARDAVNTELNPALQLPISLEGESILVLNTQARDKHEYLRRPDLGRRLDEESQRRLLAEARRGPDVQFVIGDGLSSQAVAAQVPKLLPLLCQGVLQRGWSLGRICFVRHCRVGILNAFGELVSPQLVILLIGERPGLATAESLSTYFAFRPQPGDTDERRNLISNIHARGVRIPEAAQRTLALAEQLMAAQTSGVDIKEQMRPNARLPI